MRRDHHRRPRPPLIALRPLVVTLALAGALASPATKAHGPAPAPLSALRALDDATDARPALLLTNIGLARANASGGFTYGCPSEWDRDGDGEYDEVTPLAAATDERLVVAGDPDLYLSTDDGCSFAPIASLEGAGRSTLALVAHLDTIWALIDDGATRSVVDTRDGEVIAIFEGDMHSLLGLDTGELLVAGVVPGQAPQLRLVTMRTTGDIVDERLVTSPSPELSRVRLRYEEVTGGPSLWLSASVAGGVALWKSDGSTVTELLGPQVAVHGPIALCDGVVFAAGGVLHTDPDRAPTCDLTPLDDAQVRCLTTAGDRAYLCDTFALRELKLVNGVLTAADAFTLDQLGPPDLTCLDGARADRCESSWVHFGAEAGLLDEVAPDPEPTPDPDANPQGCLGSSAPLALLPLLRPRRRRTHLPLRRERGRSPREAWSR